MIEAGARAFCGDKADWLKDNPEAAKMVDYDGMLRSVAQQTVEPVLDAVLDALEERAEVWAASIAAPKDEWEDSAAYDSMLRAMSKRDRRLIAVLRVEEKT